MLFRSESLHRLELDRVDIVYIHDPDDHEKQALNEAYPALEQLRSEGVVGAIGLGMNQSAMPTRFIKETNIDVVLIAGRFTLLDQTAAEDLLPAAVEHGVSIVTGGVFNSGILANPVSGARFDYRPASEAQLSRAQRLEEICSAYDVSLSAVAMQFSLTCPAVVSVLVGCRSAEQQERNLSDFHETIPPALWDELESSLQIRRWK